MTQRSLDLYQEELARREKTLLGREARVAAREQAVERAIAANQEAEAQRSARYDAELALRASEREAQTLRRQVSARDGEILDLKRRLEAKPSVDRSREGIRKQAQALASRTSFVADERHLILVLAGLVVLEDGDYARRVVDMATSLGALIMHSREQEPRVVGLPDPRHTGSERGIRRY